MLKRSPEDHLMRAAAAVLSMLLAGGSPVLLAQDSDDARTRPLRNGEQILVKGCLRGSMLDSMESGRTEESLLPSAHTFQLKGKKDLLKELRERHDGVVVTVTGTLKSNLDAMERGRQVGRTRIVVGADSSTRGGLPGMTDSPMPVLEVKSFEASELSCRR
jgi:hypothetical protein